MTKRRVRGAWRWRSNVPGSMFPGVERAHQPGPRAARAWLVMRQRRETLTDRGGRTLLRTDRPAGSKLQESRYAPQTSSKSNVPESLRARKATRHKVTCKRGRGAGGQTDQLPLQPEACSCRRAPSTPPVIADSCDERDEALSSDGITQPWTVESVIARWKSIACRGPCIDLLRAS